MGGRSGRTSTYPFAAPAGGDRGDCTGAGRSADPVQLARRGASGACRRGSRADRRRMVAWQTIRQAGGRAAGPARRRQGRVRAVGGYACGERVIGPPALPPGGGGGGGGGEVGVA